jgi:hypothetical protein
MLPGLLTAMAADDDGFVVPPDRAMRIVGPVGREADIAEILSTRERTGGAFGVFHALMGEGYTLLNTQRDVCGFSC